MSLFFKCEAQTKPASTPQNSISTFPFLGTMYHLMQSAHKMAFLHNEHTVN